ncbi:MAG: YggT family protein [Pyrinomonadaceae bacterium]
MVDDKLERDELQRVANYESIKSDVKAEVGSEIASEAQVPTASQAQRVENIADDMRHKAVDEVVQTEREVGRGRIVARISQIVDYIFFLIYGLLTIRLLLALFAARQGNEFVQFVRAVTDPVYAPFKGIVASPTTAEGFTLALPIVIAIVAYMLLHLAINGMLRIFSHRKVAV